MTIGEGRTHGLRSTYTDGCRCDPCRFEAREYDRVRNRRRKPNPRPVLIVAEQRWEDRKLCAGLGPAMFFIDDDEPAGADTYTEARALCAECVVWRQCLEQALHEESFRDTGLRSGFRGRMTPTERIREAKRRNRRPQVAAEAFEALRAATCDNGPFAMMEA